jgi:hypothetical protein
MRLSKGMITPEWVGAKYGTVLCVRLANAWLTAEGYGRDNRVGEAPSFIVRNHSAVLPAVYR